MKYSDVVSFSFFGCEKASSSTLQLSGVKFVLKKWIVQCEHCGLEKRSNCNSRIHFLIENGF